MNKTRCFLLLVRVEKRRQQNHNAVCRYLPLYQHSVYVLWLSDWALCYCPEPGWYWYDLLPQISCSFQTYALDLVFEWPCTLPECWCEQNNRVLRTHSFTDCNQTHFCCKCWRHSLDMTLFHWFRWYLWPRMGFKMSQEFPTVSLAVTATDTLLWLRKSDVTCKTTLVPLLGTSALNGT